MSSRIRSFEAPWVRQDLPAFAVGDSVDVAVRILEGDKERTQTFSGTIIKMRGAGLGRTFTVRRIVAGEGVERIFPIHSPVIQGVQVTRRGRVRRAKLYYLRDRVGKRTKLRAMLGKRGRIPEAPVVEAVPVEETAEA
jgi:large subunit ribosomal protein L19